MTLRVLVPGDEPALEAFLVRHADESMLLRSNMRAAGLVDRGAWLEGTYVAALERDTIVGVAGHFWNGMITLQAPAHAGAVACAVAQRSGRVVAGVLGPWAQAQEALRALGLERAPTNAEPREGLYALDLDELVVPAPLATGRVTCRRVRDDELELISTWHAEFSIETQGRTDGPMLRREAADLMAVFHRGGSTWLLEDAGRPVAFSAFSGALPDMVQVAAVWTPPDLRGRGYARAAVAGSLLAARADGVRRAVLLAHMPAAIRAYAALGFRLVGDYGLVLLTERRHFRRD
ncbi:MAG TPA: GNAT family N-acetyltransferase [Gemmatimonadales bacterium]|nr:GNAT family N-acetyltransferase [Gemmatimonadales bacterium]